MTTRILIVEDNFITSDEIVDRLGKLGYPDRETAFTGEEALAKAAEFQPDLILMDINLGEGIDGIEVASRIHAQQNVPVIYLTAYDDEATSKRAKITEPYAYLIKPFEERELIIAVEIALYKHRAEAERKKLIFELQQALAEVKTLRGILPICANCKKIRDDEGYWHEVSVYIRDHSEADFSHGVCPDCLEKIYADYPELLD